MHLLHHAWTVIDSSPPMRAFRSHRHAVFAPVLLAVVALSLRTASVPLTGDSALVSSDALGVQGGVVLPSKDATFGQDDDGITLHGGSLLSRAEGVLKVRTTDGLTLSGWNGAFFALQDEKQVTVAAFTTPVIVKSGCGTVIVPAGMQWTHDEGISDLRAHGVSVLPASFVAEKRAAAGALSAPKTPPPSDREVVLGMLRGERVGGSRDERADMEHALLAMLDGPEDIAVTALHRDGAAVFSGPHGQRMLSHALAREGLLPSLKTVLASYIEDADLRLFSALHGSLQSVAAATFDFDTPDGIALLLDLPISDTQPDAMSVVLLDRWQRAAGAYVLARADKAAALHEVLGAIRRGLEEQRRRGLIHRGVFYADAAKKIAEPVRLFWDDGIEKELSGLAALATPPATVYPTPVVQEAASSAAPLTSDDIAAAQDAVRTMLRERGGMFTKETALTVLTKDEVRVDGVFFATSQGDERFSFTVHPASSTLSAIIRSGTEHSFAVTLAQFAEWIAK